MQEMPGTKRIRQEHKPLKRRRIVFDDGHSLYNKEKHNKHNTLETPRGLNDFMHDS